MQDGPPRMLPKSDSAGHRGAAKLGRGKPSTFEGGWTRFSVVNRGIRVATIPDRTMGCSRHGDEGKRVDRMPVMRMALWIDLELIRDTASAAMPTARFLECEDGDGCEEVGRRNGKIRLRVVPTHKNTRFSLLRLCSQRLHPGD